MNLGAGLDTTFQRIDNGKIQWYDLDLPDVIKLRREWIPETDRNHYIACSILDEKWMEEIQYDPEQGLFFMAGGLMMYFHSKEVRLILQRMAEKFPGAQMMFEGVSKKGLEITNKQTMKSKKTGMLWYYYFPNPKSPLQEHSDILEVIEFFPYWGKIHPKKSWQFRTRLLIKISTKLDLSYFVYFQFESI